MLMGEPLPFVQEYVEELNRVLEELKPGQGLSSLQRKWLKFCLMGIIVTNSVCWAKFERAGLGAYSVAALSWVFRHAKIPWESLLYYSVRIIVRKYEGEQEYRYLVASDLSWRTIDIVQGYTFRWLAEVFFEDWKLYQGWGQLTKQFDDDGSSRSLILSLLLDHCLLAHPQQLARLENKLPAATVGSLLEKTRVESLLNFINSLLAADNPQQKLARLAKAVEEVFQLAPSKKHLVNKDLGRLEPSPSLFFRAKAALSAG